MTSTPTTAGEKAGAMLDGWLIWSNEHDAWWAPHSHGYTKHIGNAGRYTFGDAREICIGANEDLGRDKSPHEVLVPSPELEEIIAALQEQPHGK